MALMSSVQMVSLGTNFAAGEVRLRSTLRLKMWVSWMPANFCAASTVATELPTVPKPSRATLTGFAAAGCFAGWLTAFFAGCLDFGAMVLVVDSAGVLTPCVEAGDGLLGQEVNGGDGAIGEGERDLAIQEGVVEAGCCGLCGSAAIINRAEPSPVDGGEAHGAWLAGGIDFAAGEGEAAELGAGVADGGNLSVGGGVVAGGDAVGAGGEDLAVAHNDGSEGSATAGDDVLSRQLDGLLHEGWISLHWVAYPL